MWNVDHHHQWLGPGGSGDDPPGLGSGPPGEAPNRKAYATFTRSVERNLGGSLPLWHAFLAYSGMAMDMTAGHTLRPNLDGVDHTTMRRPKKAQIAAAHRRRRSQRSRPGTNRSSRRRRSRWSWRSSRSSSSRRRRRRLSNNVAAEASRNGRLCTHPQECWWRADEFILATGKSKPPSVANWSIKLALKLVMRQRDADTPNFFCVSESWQPWPVNSSSSKPLAAVFA
eukprot:SAG22_NODE_155_length_17123_cov_37.528489_22_plen_227_part_00